jgi:hypothetical protein
MTTRSTQQVNSISPGQKFFFFRAHVSVRSRRPGHSAAVCQFLASTLQPSRMKRVKYHLEKPRFQSSEERRNKNQ